MAKYIFAGGEGTVWDSKGSIVLSPEITQSELERLYKVGHQSVLLVEESETSKLKK